LSSRRWGIFLVSAVITHFYHSLPVFEEIVELSMFTELDCILHGIHEHAER